MMPITDQLWVVEYEDGHVDSLPIEFCDGEYSPEYGMTITANSLEEALEEYKKETPHVARITVYEKITSYSWSVL